MEILLNETFDNYNLGDLVPQGGWSLPASSESPIVQSLIVKSGSKASEGYYRGIATYNQAQKSISGAIQKTYWIKIFFRFTSSIQACPYLFVFGNANIALIFGYHSNYWQAFNGNGVGSGVYVSTGVPGQINTWFEIKAKADFTQHKWEIYIADMQNPKLTDLGFQWNTANILDKIQLYLARNTNPSNKFADEIWIGDYDPDAVIAKPSFTNKFHSVEESGGIY